MAAALKKPVFEMIYDEKLLVRQRITPEVAQKMLEFNTENRDPKQSSIDTYAADMLSGAFPFNAFPISFDWDGALLDGQHRLLALLKAGLRDPSVSIEAHVQFGLDPRVRGTVDKGVSRSNADDYAMKHKVKNAAQLQRMANAIKKILNPRRTKTSFNQMEYIIKNFESGMTVVSKYVTSNKFLSRAPIIGALAFAATAHPRLVDNLLNEIVSFKTTTVAGQKLARYAQEERPDNEDMTASKVLFAIKAHIDGAEIERLQSKDREKLIEFFKKEIISKRGNGCVFETLSSGLIDTSAS